LSGQSGKTYGLLTEAEWKYVARAGTTTLYWWGSSISTTQANYVPEDAFDDHGNYTYGGHTWRKSTVPVGSFGPNSWGLFNVHGNVFEWCEDVYHANYNGAPADGSAWLQGGGASHRMIRGLLVRPISEPPPLRLPRLEGRRHPDPQHRLPAGQNITSLIVTSPWLFTTAHCGCSAHRRVVHPEILGDGPGAFAGIEPTSGPLLRCSLSFGLRPNFTSRAFAAVKGNERGGWSDNRRSQEEERLSHLHRGA
jgi:hypothetical protein